MIHRHNPTRFRGDRLGMVELIAFVALVAFLLLAVFDSAFWQAITFVKGLVGSG